MSDFLMSILAAFVLYCAFTLPRTIREHRDRLPRHEFEAERGNVRNVHAGVVDWKTWWEE